MFPFSVSRSPNTSFPLLDEAAEHFTTPNAAGRTRPSTLEAVIGFLFKRSARHLRTHLAREHGLALTHGQALDAVSAGLGCADWNTANARLQQLARDEGSGPLPASTPAAAVPAQSTWRQGHLKGRLDFNVSSAVVGAAGSGKSVGLLFALQSRRDALTGRPVMVVHGGADERYQPNWPALLRHVPKLRAWNAEVLAGSPAITDAVAVAGDALAHEAASGDAAQQALAAGLQQWLVARAHLRPLLLVDEAYSLFGRHAGPFLAGLPKEVVVIWAAQSISDVGLPLLATRFQAVHLLSAPRSERCWEALGLAEARDQVAERLRALGPFQALTLPLAVLASSHPALLPQPAPAASFTPDLPFQALQERVLSAIRMALPQLRLQDPSLPNHIRASAWKAGRQLHVLELHLRERVRGYLSPEDQAEVARMRRTGAPVSGLTLMMLDALEGAGWLVRQVGATSLEPAEALWSIRVCKMAYKGVLVLEVPGLWEAEVGAADLEVTGALFADQGEAVKRLRGLLRTPD